MASSCAQPLGDDGGVGGDNGNSRHGGDSGGQGSGVVGVVGATATGKSALAVALALRLGGEVVSADALQLYRGMDIGTAKIPAAERAGVPHHQLDVLDVRQEASLAAYQRTAREDLAAIRDRGRLPILVGGSGLYVRAALDALAIPPTDPQVRAELEADLARVGAGRMHQRLHAVDRAAAARILPGNARRVVRALEVVRLTGGPFSASLPSRRFHVPTVLIGLRLDRPQLDARIDRRVERMWRDGFVDEVRGLLAYGLREGRTASRAIGYQQVLDVLDGRCEEGAARAATVQATRRLARRQDSWFRPDPRIRWLPADAPDLVDRATEALEAAAASSAVGAGG